MGYGHPMDRGVVLVTGTLAAEDVESIDQLLNIADRRLYLAKNSGRNRICVSDDGKSHFG